MAVRLQPTQSWGIRKEDLVRVYGLRENKMDSVINFYEDGSEEGRLLEGSGKLERIRTQELLLRWLPAPPACILDVGGGPGVYSFWLAGLGYEVVFLDPVRLHTEEVFGAWPAMSAGEPSVTRSDARALPYRSGTMDAVLMLGPLYHLTQRADRIQALAEGRRVLREGGILAAAGISRFASLLSGLVADLLKESEFQKIVDRDLAEGQHRNPGQHPAYFTTAFFHHPDELGEETLEVGLKLEALLAIEGPAVLLPDFEARLEDPHRRKELLGFIRHLESDPSTLGITYHLLAIGRKVKQ